MKCLNIKEGKNKNKRLGPRAKARGQKNNNNHSVNDATGTVFQS